MAGAFLTAVITIRLAGAAIVPEPVLDRAEQTAAGIFARAGIRIEWIDCRAQKCGALSGPWIQLIRQSRGAAGYAIMAGGDYSYAVVRYPVVERAAADLDADVAPLLGATLAHEIGHVLLGKAHARRGVMVPRFGRGHVQQAARGELGFTDEESRRLSRKLPTVAAR
jgi:hypothetical protein